MTDANDFLKDQEPAAGDPETMEAQLDQSEVSWLIHLTPHRAMIPKGYHHLVSHHTIHTLKTDQVTLMIRIVFSGRLYLLFREMTSRQICTMKRLLKN